MTEEKTTAENILHKIKSRGYWEVIIRPTRFEEERFSLSECIQKVRECNVRLRGWDYPHVSSRHPPYIGGADYWESMTDFNGHKETWRIYQSGQFVHLFGCHEDWLGEPTLFFGPSKYAHIKPGSVLGVIMTLYTVTEIYEFATRLAQKRLFNGTSFLSITLHGMKNRKLTFFDSRRYLPDEYICNIVDLKRPEKSIAVDELLGRGHEMALDHTIWILTRFKWLNPPKEILGTEQQKFLKGIYA